MELVWPAPEYLRSYCEALQRGWSPNNLRPQVAEEELTTSPKNMGSQKVILANGGMLIEEFEKLPSLGGGRELRYRITL